MKCINNYSDRNMNQEFFKQLRINNYISFLYLKEKTKPINNYSQIPKEKEKDYTNIKDNNNIEEKEKLESPNEKK